MKFAHLADCHIGGWREPQLKELTIQAFEKAVHRCIDESVDFVLICGDLFDTALPSIELLKKTTKLLNELKECNIPVYVIAGSHDFSPSGKTMLEVLEKAKLIINVAKFKEDKLQFTTDLKTNVKLTGLVGKKTCLEIEDYRNLNKEHLENEIGFKIFLFHTTIEEFKPVEMNAVECTPLSLLPKHFNYYAGGHVHYVLNKKEIFGQIVFPGPLFPNNTKELEKLKQGGFFIVESKGSELDVQRVDINLKQVDAYSFDATNKIPSEIEQEILENITNPKDKIIIIKIKGELSQGKISEVNFRKIYSFLDEACAILKNTSKVTSKEFQTTDIEIEEGESIEDTVIKTYKDTENEDEYLIKKLMNSLNKDKEEGEKNTDFEERVIKEGIQSLKLEDDNPEH